MCEFRRPYGMHQIKVILAKFVEGANWNNWMRYKLKPGEEPADLTYHDVFSVTDDDVFKHVLLHGFDERVVKETEQWPASSAPRIDYYFVREKKGCTVYTPTDDDRGSWAWHPFKSVDAAHRYIVRDLVASQWSAWCHEWHNKHPESRPVGPVDYATMFPLPANLPATMFGGGTAEERARWLELSGIKTAEEAPLRQNSCRLD